MSIIKNEFIHIYLCRHGESILNSRRIKCGQIDSPLSEKGVEQAKALGENLRNKNLSFDECYSSPLQRARDTAKLITGHDNFKIVADLIEIDSGEVSELTIHELDILMPEFKQHGTNPELCYPGGESLLDLQKRTIQWFESEFSQTEVGKKYLIVGHWGTLNIILNFLFKIPLYHYSAFYLNNCELTHVTIENNRFTNPQLQRLNFV